jgi:post-segregation antitoxin (ccd killing protein)
MNTQDIVETWRQEAIEEGCAKARADDVLTVLRVRGIAVSEAARKRILAEKDLQRLERWHEKAIVATSLGEMLDDRVAGRSSKAGRPAAHKERSGRRSARVPVQR